MDGTTIILVVGAFILGVAYGYRRGFGEGFGHGKLAGIIDAKRGSGHAASVTQ